MDNTQKEYNSITTMLSSKKYKGSLLAILGPTNTGKTHLAIERMLDHDSGIIGLPLRLLAREVYDKLIEKVDKTRVALVTGEEKILPEKPDYYICTVEAMPTSIEVDFVAVDEIQLATDYNRGYIFTDRLLALRGRKETLFLGSDILKPIIQKIFPGINIISRNRFSHLSYKGNKKISRLPLRSAIIAFSAASVYTIAELIRRQRGGAAVVLGALSPRTRNAQVELYQSGDVDYLVATDAIGMGLNMDIDHVAFAEVNKFDGYNYRQLLSVELGQIAGRAGRYTNDGTFGSTGKANFDDPDIIHAIENHKFAPATVLQWRNSKLNFSTLGSLLDGLNKNSHDELFIKSRPDEDNLALEELSKRQDISERVKSRKEVETLWEVCQLPDYRNTGLVHHVAMIEKIFKFLTDDGIITNEWMQKQIELTNKLEGDIDALSNRISHIRTCSYIANHSQWLNDAKLWQEETRLAEDKLSDALHDKLMEKFIDKQTSVLIKGLRDKKQMVTEVNDNCEVIVEGQNVGRLEGFSFKPLSHLKDLNGKAIRNAAQRALKPVIRDMATELKSEDAAKITLDAHNNKISWKSNHIARLKKGSNLLTPKIDLICTEELDSILKEELSEHLQGWLINYLKSNLEPLYGLEEDKTLEGFESGLAFQLIENLSIIKRENISDELKSLNQDQRAKLRAHKVRFGSFSIYIPLLLKPLPTSLRLLLAKLYYGGDFEGVNIKDIIPNEGLTSFGLVQNIDEKILELIGFRKFNKRAIRIDMLERLASKIRELLKWQPDNEDDKRPEGSLESGGFIVIPELLSYFGCSHDELEFILKKLGFRKYRKKIVPKPTESKDKETKLDEDKNKEIKEGGHQDIEAKVDDTKLDETKLDDTKGEETKGEETKGEETKLDETKGEDEFITYWLPHKNPLKSSPNTAYHKNKTHKTGQFNKSEKSNKPGRRFNKNKAKPPPKSRSYIDKGSKKKQKDQVDLDSPFAVLAGLKEKIK